MNLENFKDLIFKKDLSQINQSDLNALIAEFPYFNVLNLIELIHIKNNKPQEFKEHLRHSAINFNDKKRLYHFLNSDLRREVFNKYGQDEDSKVENTVSQDPNIEDNPEELLDFSYSGAPKKDISNNKDTESNLKESVDLEKSPEKKISLIDRFLNEDPGPIRADKKTNLVGDVSKSSVLESENLLTDTLAKIYVKQGLYNKAIFAYEKLSLKYPEKSVYFASQIKEIKEIINKK